MVTLLILVLPDVSNDSLSLILRDKRAFLLSERGIIVLYL